MAPSKKKNFKLISTVSQNGNCDLSTFEAVNVLMTMIMLAVMTDKRATMFIARSKFKMIKPGPASRLLVVDMLGEC